MSANDIKECFSYVLAEIKYLEMYLHLVSNNYVVNNTFFSQET